MKASPESALSRLEPRKKSINMRNTNAFDDWFTVWLPGHPERQTRIEFLYSALCRQHKGLVAFLNESYTPILPDEPKKEKRLEKIVWERKKFSREEAAERFKSGQTYAEIWRAFGVSKVAVWKALNP